MQNKLLTENYQLLMLIRIKELVKKGYFDLFTEFTG